ncbi:MAG: DUF6049 family protein [Candidatus Nanopelagicales bacterium]|nr:DUF6049 family protein [Candidatus Nanopelagicales bacterium]
MQFGAIAQALVLLLPLALFSAWLSPGPAAAAPTTDPEFTTPLTVTVRSLTPSLVDAKQRTVVKGTVTNNSSSTVSGIEVTASVSAVRYSSVSDLEQALDPTRELTTRSINARTAQVVGTIEPGADASWRVVLPAGFMNSWGNGVFVLEITARSATNYATEGTSRLALPWFDSPHSAPPDNRMSLTWLWPLTTAPGRDAENALIDDELPRELAPGGRLAELIEAAATRPELVTWVVDPALLETAASMAPGYRVVTADGGVGPVQTGSTAASWLERIRAATSASNVDVWALTYADVDVDSLGPAELGSDAVLANTLAPGAASRALGRRVEQVIAWPVGPTVSSETISLLRSADVDSLILDRAAVSGAGASESLAAVGVRGSRITAVMGDPTLNRTLAGSTSAGEIRGIGQRQLFLAQSAIMSQTDERPNAVVVPDRSWSVDAAVLRDLLATLPTAPWLRTSTLSSMLAGSSSPAPMRALTPSSGKRGTRLGTRYLREVRNAQESLSVFSEILPPPGDLAGTFETALLRAESAAWRPQRARGRELLARIRTQLDATRARVRPVSGGQITLASATSRVPVTVVNDLDVPVQVGVRLIGDPTVRLVQSEAMMLEIPPGQKVSTEIPIQLLGAGELPVDVQLTTPSGRLYGEPTRLTLRTTAYGAAATYVVAAAFIALGVTIVISTVRRRRRFARKAGSKLESTDDRQP